MIIPSQPNPPVVINQSELGGIYLGTIRGEEIIPRLIRNPTYWRGQIHDLIQQLISIHPHWWVDAREDTMSVINGFFARNKLTFRINLSKRPSPRPRYSQHDRQYLNGLFYHNLGYLNGSKNGGVAEINMAILNLWSILEFLDRH
jgi:hypothetical protein